jgi:alpha-beta hydrolase superfamily lysophospholipase
VAPTPILSRFVTGLMAAALGALLLLLGLPERPPDLRSHPRPAASYAEAARRVAALQSAEDARISLAGRTLLLDHGRRTATAVLLFHGFANCPEQFRALALRLRVAGANVYVPCLPHHGLADRMTTDLSRLTAEELIRFSDAQIDIACGLGDTLIVAGLSLGALQAAWSAQERPEVERAVLISPLFGLALVPQPLLAPLRRFWLRTPNQFLWWDPRLREALPGPRHVYPRYSTRALAQALREAAAVRQSIRDRPTLARSVLVVTVAGDLAVNNATTARVVREWRRRDGGRVAAYEFTREMRLGHDLVDPEQPYQRAALVHPLLERMILGR